MLLVNTIVLSYILISIFATKLLIPVSKSENRKLPSGQYATLKLAVILLSAFLFRLVLALTEPGYQVDIGCFSGWADGAYRLGLSRFYTEIGFCDYTPGYIYILWLVGFLRSQVSALASSVLLLKTPAMVCDLITGALLYHLAKRNFSENSALLLSSLYLFHPVILIDSAMWGQVDSVFTLFLLLTVYFLSKEKRIFAYFFFAIGCVLKLQTLVLFPVVLAAFIGQVILRDFTWKKLGKDILGGLGAILLIYLSILPFHFDHYGFGFIELCRSTLSSYEYVTVNAYNFWEIFALNWHSQEETFCGISYASWGTFFLVCMTLATLFLVLRHSQKKLPGKYYLAGAFLISAFFTLSVRVHERYMFPVFILLLCAYISYPRRELLYAFWGLTFTQAANIWHSFKFFDPADFDWYATFPRIIAFISTLLFGYLSYLCIRILVVSRPLAPNLTEVPKPAIFLKPFVEGIKPVKSKACVPFTRSDWLVMSAITIVYACVALTNIGDKQTPATSYETFVPNDSLMFDFSSQASYPVYAYYFNGRIDNRTYYVEQSCDLSTWETVTVNYQPQNSFRMDYPFCWNYVVLDITKPYVRFLCPDDGTVLNELVFLDADRNECIPNNAPDYEELFDESYLLPAQDTYMASTYFDEIYHARTAYEMTEGLYNYEWTHPPLGKIIISIGIRLFGMCPFGWRIMGVMIGIFMLPPFYYLAKMLVRKTWLAAITATLLAADFMHFTQTRIATIDVFVTFFIILMYLFMYLYTQKSFYDTPDKKTWPILFLCGISMGLGCACKWTGIYAGAGLAVIFFFTMGKRYLEYVYAAKHPKGSTDGISHKHILDTFAPGLIRTCLVCIVAFIILPGLIYTLSYLPFSDGTNDGLITRMLNNQKAIWYYHSGLDATHPFSSVWYEWILDKKPVLYYSKILSDGSRSCISAMGNPLIWWSGIVAFFFLLTLVLRKKDENSLLLVISYLAQLLPWIMVTRCTFIYHYFPSVPFLILMIGYSMYVLSEVRPDRKNYQLTVRIACILFAVLAVILFILFYPVLSGHPVSQQYIDQYLLWLKSWQLY